MTFSDMKIKDIMADPDLMAVIKRFIPDWEKYPVGLIKNKKVSEVAKIAKDRKLCTDADIAELEKEMNAVLAKKKK